MIEKSTPIKRKPLVSVLIPATNEEKHISTCIKSLLNQTYKPLEILIIDNSSIDKTWEIIQGFKKYRVIPIKLTGKQSGPGKAWNHAVKIARGEIFMFGGADLEYGKSYIETLIKPILKGVTIGTAHYEEKIANLSNFWSRAFRKRRVIAKNNRCKTFWLMRREAFNEYGPFDTSLGYGDDLTFYKNHRLEAVAVHADVRHHNPETLKETWNHDVWVGQSFNHPLIILFGAPLFPVYSLYKTVWHLIRKDFYWKFIFFLPLFYTLRYFGYMVGSIRKLRKK